jgi:hypothetical protein
MVPPRLPTPFPQWCNNRVGPQSLAGDFTAGGVRSPAQKPDRAGLLRKVDNPADLQCDLRVYSPGSERMRQVFARMQNGTTGCRIPRSGFRIHGSSV